MKPATNVALERSVIDKYTENATAMSMKRSNQAMNATRGDQDKTHFTVAAIVIAIAILGFLGIAADAQDIANPQRGVQHGASYQISDIETINMTNGNLMLNIPLAGLPKGRGQTGASISLMYNSKLYDTRVEELLDHSQQWTLQNVLYASYTSGWKYVKNDYTLDLTNRFETYSPGACNIADVKYSWRLNMRMPDGSMKEFRPTDRDDIQGDGHFDVTPDGKMHYACPTDPTQWSTSGMVYYSTDGTYTKLVVDYVASPTLNGETNPWTMYMPDGSKITGQTGYPTRHYDRNGNYVEGLEDVFGREITLQQNVNNYEDHVTMLGVEGEEITWKVFWKDIEVDKEYETTGFDGGYGRGGSSDQPFGGLYKVVDRIELPEQLGDLQYEFHYNTEDSGTGWGQIDQITLPSGATVEYTYNTLIGVNTQNVLEQRVASKELNYLAEYDGGSSNVADTWTYSFTDTTSTTTNPDGSTVTQTFGNVIYENIARGLVKKILNSNGSRTDKIWTPQSPPVGNSTIYTNPYVDIEFTTIADSSGTPTMTKIVDNAYDLNGNLTEVKEYDWVTWSSVPKDGSGNPTGIPGGATLKRITVNEYYNSPTGNNDNGYWDADSPPARNVLKSTEVQNGSSTPFARTEFFYDDEDDTANLTSTKVWDSFKGGSSQSYSNPLTSTNSHTTSATYDAYGNVTQTTDANGNDTVITYGSVTCPSGTVTGLYPTLTEVAEGTSVERTTSAVYDCYTGVVTTATDEDNDVSVVTVYDDLGRPTITKNAYGTALESWVQTEYHDEDRYVVTKADLEIEGDGKKVSIKHFDQLGRLRLSRSLENSTTESVSNEEHGIKVQTRYKSSGVCTFDSGETCSFRIISNPYRAATSAAASGENTMGWTLSQARNDGYYSETQSFAGAGLPSSFGGSNSTSTGIAKTSVDANATSIEDQSGKLKRSIYNGLGQLVRLDEPNSSNQLGSTSSPSQFTEYSYDPLNNLTQIDHGSQDRVFTYSSLSRLLSLQTPEGGSTTFVYDGNGNQTSRTDARLIVTSFTYDQLNRMTAKNYGDSTPDVTYTYDNKINAYGRLTKVATSGSTTEYTSFDILGRVTSHKQTTDSADYLTEYVYNLSGALVEQTYPGGRVVKTTLYPLDGTLSQVQSKRSGETYRNFANSFEFNVIGSPTKIRLGNGKWESTTFNSRMQPITIGLGTGATSQNLLKLEYSYGTTTNNGNVVSQTITVPGVAHPFVQSYSYDSLNRVTNAEETYNSSQTWEQTFTYDRFGNRNFDEANTTTLPKNCGSSPNYTVCAADRKLLNPTIDSANNRIDTDEDYVFDGSGNLTENSVGGTYTYNAENQITEVEDDQANPIAQYWYDGEKKRIKKYVPDTGETTIFVYDAIGKLIQEHSTVVATESNAKTLFTTNDNLGSPRINTDGVGSVASRHDYHPFGEEITTAQRTSGIGYNADTLRKQFTGYERDDETGLDFAQARYLSSFHGRFTSVDPVTISLDRMRDPQRLNLYAYVANNPLKFTDPSGEEIYQLGQATVKNLENEIEALKKQIKASPNDVSLTARLTTLQADLKKVIDANKAVKIWIDALKKSGDTTSRRVEDYKVTTDPVADLTKATNDYNKTAAADDEFGLDTLGWSQSATVATTIGKDIIFLSGSDAMLTTVSVADAPAGTEFTINGTPANASEINLVGGSFIIHEEKHKNGDTKEERSEYSAYEAQLDFLDKQNTKKPFKNQGYLNFIKGQLEAGRGPKKQK